jgi:hypothetical protein
MKDGLLVIKYTQNCCANCPYLPILHHLHLIEHSGSIDGELDSELETREHVLGCKVYLMSHHFCLV